MDYINLTVDNVGAEHICCAISDKKHQEGVFKKKEWLKSRITEGHVFRKLNERGKVFIEYAPLSKAWVPISGVNIMYIYCLWASGKFKGEGHGHNLLTYAIEDAKNKGMNGICIISMDKKKPFISDPKFLKKYGFKVVDSVNGFNLMYLSFKEGEEPKFSSSNDFKEKGVHIFYNNQCPYTEYCLTEIKDVNPGVNLHEIKSLSEAKSSPVILNNFAVIKDGKYITHELLNANRYKKMVD